MLTITVGLPGSGKTQLAVIEFLKNRHLSIYEDCMGGGIPWAESTLDGLANAVRLRRPIIANDALLCLDPWREALRRAVAPHLGPGYAARWLFFSNSPGPCRRNVERRYRAELVRSPERADERRRLALELIDELSPAYRIPAGADVLPVVDYSV